VKPFKKDVVLLHVRGQRMFVFVVALVLITTVIVAEPSVRATPEELLDALERTTPGRSQEERDEAYAVECGTRAEILEAIASCGEQAVPVIEEKLKRVSDEKVRQDLVFAIGELPGERASRILIDLFCSEEEPGSVRSVAMYQLLRRPEETMGGPLPREVVCVLLEELERDDIFQVGAVARCLGKCTSIPAAVRAEAILRRFLRELSEPTDLAQAVFGAYTSPRAYVLNKFLLAFHYIGEPAIPALRKAYDEATAVADGERVKWLALSLGMARDVSISDAVEDILRNDQDRYVRCEAVRAYALSAGEAAIPLLRELAVDRTPSEYESHGGRPCYLIAFTARDELSRLGVSRASLPSLWDEPIPDADGP